MTPNDEHRNLPTTIEDNAIQTDTRAGAGRVGLTFLGMAALIAIFLYGVNSQRTEVAHSDQTAAQANAQAASDAQPPPAQNEPSGQQKQEQARQQQGKQPATTGQGGDQGGQEPRPAQQAQPEAQRDAPRAEQPAAPNRNSPQPPQGNGQQ